jgi:hypothetical protein
LFCLYAKAANNAGQNIFAIPCFLGRRSFVVSCLPYILLVWLCNSVLIFLSVLLRCKCALPFFYYPHCLSNRSWSIFVSCFLVVFHCQLHNSNDRPANFDYGPGCHVRTSSCYKNHHRTNPSWPVLCVRIPVAFMLQYVCTYLSYRQISRTRPKNRFTELVSAVLFFIRVL